MVPMGFSILKLEKKNMPVCNPFFFVKTVPLGISVNSVTIINDLIALFYRTIQLFRCKNKLTGVFNILTHSLKAISKAQHKNKHSLL